MTTEDDIEFVLAAPDTYFFCKKCKTKFRTLSESEILRWKVQGTESTESQRVIQNHIRTCNHTY